MTELKKGPRITGTIALSALHRGRRRDRFQYPWSQICRRNTAFREGTAPKSGDSMLDKASPVCSDPPGARRATFTQRNCLLYRSKIHIIVSRVHRRPVDFRLHTYKQW